MIICQTVSLRGAGVNIREERMKFTRNRLVAGLLVTVGVVASVMLGTQSHALWNAPDCTNNSIIKCGAFTNVHDTTSDVNLLRARYDKSTEVQRLYAHFGVTKTNMHVQKGHKNLGHLWTGEVTRSGNVILDGKVVATNAQSVGRWQDNGTGYKGTPFTVAGHTYYKSSTQHRFGFSSESAYILLDDNGQFVGAIIKGCGNIIPATPVKPQKPVYTCDSLKAVGVKDVANNTLKFNYVTAATAKNGAKITGYSYNFGDGTTANAGSKTSHTYKKSGTYTTTVTVHFTVKENQFAATRSVSDSCKTTVKPHKNVVAPPQVACSALKLITVKDGTYNLEASAFASPGIPLSRKAGSISGYTYTVKDANGKVVKTINKDSGLQTQSSESGNFTLTPGEYTAQVVVHSNAGDKTGSQCTVKISVPMPPKMIQACRLSDYTVVTINEKDYDSSKYTKDLSQCEDIQVCDTTTGSIVEVKKGQVDNDRYTTDLSQCKVQVCDTTTNTVVTVTKDEAKDSKYTTDLSQCEDIQVCDTTTKQIVTVKKHEAENNDKYTTDLSKCETTPTPPQTPPELPHTGVSNVITSLVGAGSLIAALSYYVASRRAL